MTLCTFMGTFLLLASTFPKKTKKNKEECRPGKQSTPSSVLSYSILYNKNLPGTGYIE